jgi:hypothetical protein
MWSTGAVLLSAAAPPCAAAAGQVRIAVVVDFGTEPGAPAPGSVCVPVEDRSNGAAVLQARARQLGTPAPRFDGSGFLCAIDGWPESGCGERTADGYRYWSYWQGTTDGWRYSQVGPTATRAKEPVVEGWRFLDGKGTGTDTDDPPRGSARATDTCAAAPAVTTTAPGTRATPSTTTPGTRATTTTITPALAAPTTPTTVSPTTAPPTSSTSRSATSGGAESRLAASERDDDSGGFPLGLVVGLAAIVLIGAGAALQTRRRGAR